MHDPSGLVMALLAGLMLGGMFFGGLWWTIRHGVSSSVPALWFLGSVLLRSAGVVVGLSLVAQGDWQRMLACLVGFVLVRLVATRLVRITLAGGVQ